MTNLSPTLRVLMFGWEFPPFQAGGLATAMLGLVKGIRSQGLERPQPTSAPTPTGREEQRVVEGEMAVVA